MKPANTEKSKIEYRQPEIVDLGAVPQLYGGACSNGNTAPGQACNPVGGTAGSCSVGTTVGKIGPAPTFL